MLDERSIGDSVKLYEQYVFDLSPEVLVIQFAALFLLTIIFTYHLAFSTRQTTFIKSHRWLLIETAVASALSFICFRICVASTTIGGRSRFLGIKGVGWFILINVWAYFTDFALWKIDRGRALVDLYGNDKTMWHIDFRLIRRVATVALTGFCCILFSWLFYIARGV